MRTGLLFPEITDTETRKLIKKSLLSIKYLIPSIKSMHENFKLLDVGAKILKDLILGKGSGCSVEGALYGIWKDQQDLRVEVAEGMPRPIRSSSKEMRWRVAYKQIWISALRSFADLGGRGPLKENGQDPYLPTANPSVQYQFAKVARELGFQTPRVNERLNHDPRRQTLRLSVSQLYKSHSPDAIEKIVDDMLIQLEKQDKIEIGVPPKLQDYSIAKDDLERRWGIPYRRAYEICKARFFLPNISETRIRRSDDVLNAMFVQQDFMRSFFGPTVSLDTSVEVLSPETNDGGSDGSEMEISPTSLNENNFQHPYHLSTVDPVTYSEPEQRGNPERNNVLSDLLNIPAESRSLEAELPQISTIHTSSAPSIFHDSNVYGINQVPQFRTTPTQIPTDEQRSPLDFGEIFADDADSQLMDIDFSQNEIETNVARKDIEPINSVQSLENSVVVLPFMRRELRISSFEGLDIPQEVPRSPLEFQAGAISTPNSIDTNISYRENHVNQLLPAIMPLEISPTTNEIRSMDSSDPANHGGRYAQALVPFDKGRYVRESMANPIKAVQSVESNLVGFGANFQPASQAILPSNLWTTAHNSIVNLPLDPPRSPIEYSLPMLPSTPPPLHLGPRPPLTLTISDATRHPDHDLPPGIVSSVVTTDSSSQGPKTSPRASVSFELNQDARRSVVSWPDDTSSSVSFKSAAVREPLSNGPQNRSEQSSYQLPPDPARSTISSLGDLRTPYLQKEHQISGSEVQVNISSSLRDIKSQTNTVDFETAESSVAREGKEGLRSENTLLSPVSHIKNRGFQGFRLPLPRPLEDGSNPASQVPGTVVPWLVASAQENLRFMEYNGMIISSIHKRRGDMRNYLANRKGWVMFVLESRNTFRTIPRGKIVQYMDFKPEKVYCLVEENKVGWWKQFGANYLQNRILIGTNEKKFIDRGQPVHKIHRQKLEKKMGRGTRVLETSRRTRPKNASEWSLAEELLPAQGDLPLTLVREFGPELSILDCEREFNYDEKYSLDHLRRFLSFNNSTYRTLHCFEKSVMSSLKKEVITSFSEEYCCGIAESEGFRYIPWEKNS